MKQKKAAARQKLTANFETYKRLEDTNLIDKNKENLVFNYLCTGAKLDQLKAERLLDCKNLYEVIQSIRFSGVDVVTNVLWIGKNRKVFQYHLKLPKP